MQPVALLEQVDSITIVPERHVTSTCNVADDLKRSTGQRAAVFHGISMHSSVLLKGNARE
jgi:hypothetical protein